MRKITVVIMAVALSGCATTPRPQLHVMPKVAKQIVAPAPAETPNAKVQSRFGKFRGKLKWFHH